MQIGVSIGSKPASPLAQRPDVPSLRLPHTAQERNCATNFATNHGRRLKGVIGSEILAPAGAPDWVFEQERLWNTVEQTEKRKEAQLAREFVLAVPRELDADTHSDGSRLGA